MNLMLQAIRASLAILMLWLLSHPVLGAGPQAVVFVYHRFGENDVPSTNIRLEQIDAQLQWLAQAGAHFASLDDILTALENNAPLPDFTVAFTADDAYASIASEAWPRLKSRDIPLTIFVATEAVDRQTPRYMDWETLRRLKSEGVTIGHHGAAHTSLPSLSLKEAQADLEQASKRMQEELGQAPKIFAHPYGEYSVALLGLLRDMGFRAGFAQFSSVVSPSEDRFALPRFAINEAYGGMERFRLVARARALPVIGIEPADPVLTARQPPPLTVILADEVNGLERLTCFASGSDAPLTITHPEAGVVEVRFEREFEPGRGRVNCTLPAPEGRWYWFGRPFFVPG